MGAGAGRRLMEALRLRVKERCRNCWVTTTWRRRWSTPTSWIVVAAGWRAHWNNSRALAETYPAPSRSKSQPSPYI